MERGFACLDGAGVGKLLLQCRWPVRVAGLGHRQLDVEVALDSLTRSDDSLGDGLELLLIPRDFLGQVKLDVQPFGLDVRSAKVTARFFKLMR